MNEPTIDRRINPGEEEKFLGLISKNIGRAAAIVIAVWGIFQGIFLPLQQIQLQLTQINVALVEYKEDIKQLKAKDAEHDRRLDRVDPLTRRSE